MIKIIKKISQLIEKKLKKKILLIQLFNVVVSCLEILTLGSLALFIGLLSSSEKIITNKYLNLIYNHFQFEDKFDFIFFLGSGVLVLYIFTAIMNIIVTWQTNVMSCTINQYLSNLILKNYIFKNWIEFTKLKISNINKDIFTDLNIVSNKVVTPVFNLINKIFIALSLLIALILYDYKVAIFGTFLYALIYIILIFFVKKINFKIIKNISINRKKNHTFIHNFFSGFKEVIIFNLRNIYFEKIRNNNNNMILPNAHLLSLSQIPRFLVELISYVVVLLGILFVISSGKDLNNLLPTVTVYAFAGLKLLPAFQQIYLAYVSIKAGQVALNNLYPKILKAKNGIPIHKQEKTNVKLPFNKYIKLKNVYFNYDLENQKQSVKKLNIRIEKNSIIGIAGPSGSGKSTIIDIISGLLKPSKGNIYIDGKLLNLNDYRKWQNNFGIVSQMPFLSSDTIVDNISFGKLKGRQDLNRVNDLIKKVELKNFVSKQKKGIYSKISDKGINISGGERQRLAIARSLFFENDIIVFDEATNALDKITENKIIKFVNKLSKTKTIIIITHRVNTLKICDKIFLIKDGELIQSGNYNFLKRKNKFFKSLISEV